MLKAADLYARLAFTKNRPFADVPKNKLSLSVRFVPVALSDRPFPLEGMVRYVPSDLLLSLNVPSPFASAIQMSVSSVLPAMAESSVVMLSLVSLGNWISSRGLMFVPSLL